MPPSKLFIRAGNSIKNELQRTEPKELFEIEIEDCEFTMEEGKIIDDSCPILKYLSVNQSNKYESNKNVFEGTYQILCKSHVLQ